MDHSLAGLEGRGLTICDTDCTCRDSRNVLTLGAGVALAGIGPGVYSLRVRGAGTWSLFQEFDTQGRAQKLSVRL
jgi:hypothetical protein